MDHSFSDRLLLFPIFQGFSRLDFLDIVEQTPFDCFCLKSGEALSDQDEESRGLNLLTSGEVDCETESPGHVYRFVERLKAPWIVQPDRLFGLHNRYSSTIRAVGEVKAVSLDKQSVRRLMTDYPIFQINFFNLLSTIAQQHASFLWQTRGATPEDRFRSFLLRRSHRPIGLRELYIKMEDLATELGTTRLRVSQMLADLSERELLTYSRGKITVPALELL